MNNINNKNVVFKTNFSDLTLIKRGKVRDIYDFDNKVLIVATDRISAFDIVFNEPIPGKGHILTKISEFWFETLKWVVDTHFISTRFSDLPHECKKYKSILEGRCMLVRKATPIPFECVVRGFLTGSAYKEYQKTRSICGITLPPGLKEADRIDPPIFTPATKATEGSHDINISFEKMKDKLGSELASLLRDKSMELYIHGCNIALKKGIIIADTKFEFGTTNDGKVILIDELLTPDSSRFWPKESYCPGKPQESLDKQFVRDYLTKIKWDKTPPPPSLPPEVISGTLSRYKKIIELLEK